MNNFNNWEDFFKKNNFTFFRTSIIQKKYIETIYNFCKKINATNIMEIASGSGYTSIILDDLLKNNCKIYCTDLSKEIIDNLSNKNYKNICFEVQDSKKISHKNKSIDIIYHQGFLEHFSNNEIVDFLNEQARVAKYIIFDVPISRRNNKIQEFGNERFLSLKEWKSVLKTNNFKILKITGRRFNNWWKKFIPHIIIESDWFGKYFGESIIIICEK